MSAQVSSTPGQSASFAGASSSAPLLPHPPTATATSIPPRTSSSHHSTNYSQAAAEQWTFQTPNGSIVSPSSPPRRKSSKRPINTSSGDWTGSTSAGKKPATLSSSPPDRPKSSHHHKHHHRSRDIETMLSPAISGASPPAKTHVYSVPMSPPPPDPLKGIGDDLIYNRHNSWSAEKEKILLGPFDYMYGHPGKDIRSQLISAFNSWLNVPASSLTTITRVVGMLHTASLLVDDVEDSSNLRRGIPVAHSLFGIPQTLNSANYVYFLALQELGKLPNAALSLQIYTEELLNLHRGQGMDLFWRDTLTCPSESDYLEMVSNKTGGLFRLAIKLMQAESPNSSPSRNGHTPNFSTPNPHAPQTDTDRKQIDCLPLIQAISLYFQILDDHLNLSSPIYTERKGLCEDLTEGKFSFPVIHAIRADPSNLELINILRMKTTDEDVKRYAVGYMERMGSFEYTRNVLGELERKIGGLVRELEGHVGGEEGRSGAEAIRNILGKLKAL